MNAAEILITAQRAGVQLRVEGTELVLRADREPSAGLLSAIEQHKPEIVALLTAARFEGWDSIEGLRVLDADSLRRWFVVEARGLGCERILVVADRRLEEEARSAHPDLVLYMPWEVRSLLNRDASTAFASRVHLVKKMFDGVIVPESGEVRPVPTARTTAEESDR